MQFNRLAFALRDAGWYLRQDIQVEVYVSDSYFNPFP
jgi:hypothetical protein